MCLLCSSHQQYHWDLAIRSCAHVAEDHLALMALDCGPAISIALSLLILLAPKHMLLLLLLFLLLLLLLPVAHDHHSGGLTSGPRKVRDGIVRDLDLRCRRRLKAILKKTQSRAADNGKRRLLQFWWKASTDSFDGFGRFRKGCRR